jgi:hypothetical protein
MAEVRMAVRGGMPDLLRCRTAIQTLSPVLGELLRASKWHLSFHQGYKLSPFYGIIKQFFPYYGLTF